MHCVGKRIKPDGGQACCCDQEDHCAYQHRSVARWRFAVLIFTNAFATHQPPNRVLCRQCSEVWRLKSHYCISMTYFMRKDNYGVQPLNCSREHCGTSGCPCGASRDGSCAAGGPCKHRFRRAEASDLKAVGIPLVRLHPVHRPLKECRGLSVISIPAVQPPQHLAFQAIPEASRRSILELKLQAIRIAICDRIPRREPVGVQPARQADRIRLRELARLRVVVAVALVHQPARIPHLHAQAAQPVAFRPYRLRLGCFLEPRTRVPPRPRHRHAVLARVRGRAVAALSNERLLSPKRVVTAPGKGL
jgi:hypothetical protein